MNYINPYYFGQQNSINNYKEHLSNIIQQAQSQLASIESQQVQPASLTQNIQITPNSPTTNFKIVSDKASVDNEMVLTDTYFLENSLTKLWIKNTRGEIREFELTEIVPKDEKDMLIEDLQRQLLELKGSIGNGDTTNNERYADTKVNDTAKTKESTNVRFHHKGAKL